MDLSGMGSTAMHDSKAYSIGKYERSKSNKFSLIFIIVVAVEAKFVNPKIVTNVPGPGAHDPSDVYTTKQGSSLNWSINKNERHPKAKSVKHPGP